MAASDGGTSTSMAGLQPRYIPVTDLPTTRLQQGAVAIIFIMTSLAFVFWAARMYARYSKKQLGIDDWLATAAMTFSLGMVVPNYFFLRYEYIGFPTSKVPESYDPEPVLFWNWILQVLYNPILALVKSSVLFLLLRLGGHRRSIRWSIYALNAFNMALMMAIFLTVVFQTIPIYAFWKLSVKRQGQIDGPLFYISSAIVTIITDVFALVLPFWVFLGLKMRLAAKLALMMVFLMGGVVTVVAIIRVVELYKKFYIKGYDSRDSLGDTLSSVEVNLAIIACCGPALRPLFRRMFPRLFSGRTSDENANYDTPNRYGNSTQALASFQLKDMRRSKTQTEIRGYTPNGSEEEIMTYNGILRTKAVKQRVTRGFTHANAAMSTQNDPETAQRSTEQTPLLADQPQRDGGEDESQPDAEPTLETRPRSWYAWRIFWAVLAIAVLAVFIKGWIDADDSKFDLKGALKRALGGGLSGAAAMVLQVLLLMYRHGTSFTIATRTLYTEGGIRRYYQGIAPALFQGPISRFGDTAANAGILALLQSNPYLRGLPSPIKTVFASLCAAAFRMILTPIDTLKTTLQAQGARGTAILRRRVKSNGIGSLWWGAFATAAATFVGHYPWFATYNFLSEAIAEPPKHPLVWWLLRLAFIGFCASVISDSISNSLRVVKTYRQVNDTKVSYAEAARAVVIQDGVVGLLGRGLKTRILANGLQGILFSILWKLFLDLWEKRT
ncbi:hypothetical protein F66182_872 [Fusarium sp. NRRL 66182]|nr:hypothetical protein F66182_872 [Fusarium sp. NRRL 66182]